MSSRSLRRAISCSWSAAVEKKPPRSGSAKRSSIVSASAARLDEPARRRTSPRTASAAPRAGTRGPPGRRPACARPVVEGAQQPTGRVAQVAQHERRRMRPRRRGSRGRSSTAPASASAEIISAFQAVRRLSSSPGRTRSVARAAAASALISASRRSGLRRRAHRGCSRPRSCRALGHAEVRDRLVGEARAEHGAQLVERPHVELALDALGVGVQRRAEAALGLRAARAAPSRASRRTTRRSSGSPRHLQAVQVRAREQRVVVEHLLEVRDDPARVDRVAREAAADLVVDAAARPSRAACAAPSPSRRGAAGTRSPTRRELRRARPSRRHVASYEPRSVGDAPRRAPRPGSSSASGGLQRAPSRSRRGSAALPSSISSRCARARRSAIASSTSGQLGMPWRGSGGK